MRSCVHAFMRSCEVYVECTTVLCSKTTSTTVPGTYLLYGTLNPEHTSRDKATSSRQRWDTVQYRVLVPIQCTYRTYSTVWKQQLSLDLVEQPASQTVEQSVELPSNFEGKNKQALKQESINIGCLYSCYSKIIPSS